MSETKGKRHRFRESIRTTSAPHDGPRHVPTPFWPAIDGQVCIRQLNAAERIRASGGEDGQFWARVLALALCDADGDRIYDSMDEGEAELAGQKPELAEGLIGLFGSVRDWCLPSVDEEKKSSAPTPSCDSPTSSPSPSESPMSKTPEDSSISSAPASSPAG